MSSTRLVWASDHRDSYDTLTAVVAENLTERGASIEVLEAGCGRSWVLGDLGSPTHLTGVDLDAEALRLRVEQQADLDVAIHGDLMTVDVPREAFDLVFSSFVLEHLEHPEQALDRFFSWVQPNGLVAVIIPDRDTAKGLATRLSPFFLHVWYYRWIKGRKTAGKPGYEPYRTFYGKVVGRKGLRSYCESRGHRLVAEIAITMRPEDEGGFTMMMSKLISLLTGGRKTADYCNLIAVMAKR